MKVKGFLVSELGFVSPRIFSLLHPFRVRHVEAHLVSRSLQDSTTNLSSTLLGNRLNNGSLPYFTVGVDLARPDISTSGGGSGPQTSEGGVVNWGAVDQGRVESAL